MDYAGSQSASDLWDSSSGSDASSLNSDLNSPQTFRSASPENLPRELASIRLPEIVSGASGDDRRRESFEVLSGSVPETVPETPRSKSLSPEIITGLSTYPHREPPALLAESAKASDSGSVRAESASLEILTNRRSAQCLENLANVPVGPSEGSPLRGHRSDPVPLEINIRDHNDRCLEPSPNVAHGILRDSPSAEDRETDRGRSRSSENSPSEAGSHGSRAQSPSLSGSPRSSDDDSLEVSDGDSRGSSKSVRVESYTARFGDASFPLAGNYPSDSTPHQGTRLGHRLTTAPEAPPSQVWTAATSFHELPPEGIASLLETMLIDSEEDFPLPKQAEEASSRSSHTPTTSHSSVSTASSTVEISALAALLSGDQNSDVEELSTFWLEQSRKDTMDS